MNAEIERYRISLGQGVGNPDWGEESEDSDGAEDGSDEDTTPPDNGDSGSGGGSTGDGSGVGGPIDPGPGGDDPDL